MLITALIYYFLNRISSKEHNFTSLPTISVIHPIDCKGKKSTRFFSSTPSIFSKSLTAGNIAIFKAFNIVQMGLKKEDAR